MKKNHLAWIDSYKGLLMLMVIFAHIASFTKFSHYEYSSYFIYPFSGMRMPAFFFISGYLLSQYHALFFKFSKHRLRQIVVPYFLFFLMHYIFWYYFLQNDYPENFSWIEPFKGALTGKAERVTEMQFTMITAFPLWFVTTLFVAEIYFFILKSIMKTNLQLVISLIVMALFGHYLSQYLNNISIRPWWNLDIAITASVFYGLGYMVKMNNYIQKIMLSKNWLNLLFLLFFLILSINISLNNHSSVAFGKYGVTLYYYFSAFSGILALIFFVQLKKIQNNTFLNYIGKNTYIILSFHMIAIYLANNILELLFIEERYYKSLIGSIGFVLLFLFIIILFIEIINKFLPFILNNKKIKK